MDKEILDLVDNLNIDENEFNNIDVELSHIERKRIQKNYRKNINKKNKNKKVKKVAIASGIIITLGTCGFMVTPTLARNVPFIGRIHETLGLTNPYEDYTKYVGQSVKVKGGTYTIEEIMVTPYKSLIAIRITGDEPISDDMPGFMVNPNIGGAEWSTGRGSGYRIDDHNIVRVIEHGYKDKVPEKAEVKIIIHQVSTEEDPAIFGEGEFEFKIDFGKSYDEFKSINVNNVHLKDLGIKMNKINSDILATDIIGAIYKNDNLENVSEDEVYRKYRELRFILNLDGKYYSGFTSPSGIIEHGEFKGDIRIEIPNLKTNDINNSKNKDLYVYEDKNPSKEYTEESVKEPVMKNSNGVNYPEIMEFIDGHKGKFYKVERNEDTIKIYYKGREQDISSLADITGWINREIVIYPTISKVNEDEFVMEFKGVPRDKKFVISSGWIYKSLTCVGEYKIK